jgi:hypothetical protein
VAQRSTKDKVLHIETSTTTEKDGETKEKKTTRKILLEQEPNYIKLYVNTLLTFKDLPKQMNATLIELLNLMTFANKEAKHGGQLIILNMFVKEEIIERLDIKMNTFKKTLTALTKSGILKRIGNSTYQANPEMFGRGEWTDIKAIRATFDFNIGTVVADIEADLEN